MFRNPHITELSRRGALLIGIALLVVSCAVIAGWITHSLLLVQVLPGAPAMRFNTATCFLLLGVALISLSHENRWLPRYLGATIAIFAAATVSQDWFGIDLGIDNLLFDDWRGVGPNASGRMAINSAICFVVSGLSIVSLSIVPGHRLQPLFESLCGSVVVANGTVSAFGYFLGLEASYGWGGSLGMAIHTALSFTLVGLLLIGLALVHQRRWSASLPLWLPWPVSLSAATAALALCQAIILDEHKQASQTTQARAEKLTAQIKLKLTSRIQSMERMADRWATAGRPQRTYWEADASQSLKHFSDFRAIAWVNPEQRIAWLVTRHANAYAIHGSVMSADPYVEALRLARDERRTALTPAIKQDGGGCAGSIICPVFRGDQFEGCCSATFSVRELVDELAREDRDTGYRVAIFDESKSLFRSYSRDSTNGYWSTSSVDLDGVHWQVRMSLTPEAAAARCSRLPAGVFCCGLLFATVLGLAIHYALRAHERSQTAERASAELLAVQVRFRAIFDQTFQLTGLLSPDGVVLEANRTALEFAGVTEADVRGRRIWDTVWWSHSVKLQQELKLAVEAAANGSFQRFETTHPDKNGATHYIDFSLKPVRDEHGRVTLLIPEGRDVTERIQAEQQLRETQERFELAVRGSSDGIWDWNLETGETYYSPRFKELLGYDEAALIDWKELLHPDDRESTLAALAFHLGQAAPFDVACRMWTAENKAQWVRLRGEATRLPDGTARRMAGSLSDIRAIKEVEEKLASAALLDALTGLPNRALLLDRLQHLMARAARNGKHSYAVMFLDFDRFKIINDSLGHEVGDALLRAIADRLRNTIRSVDSVARCVTGNTTARLGGDEFVILIDELANPEDIHLVTKRLLEALSNAYELDVHEVYSTASIGIVLGSPEYSTADEVLRDADTAMYEAKRMGKARCVIFDDSMRRGIQRRLMLENDLRKAIGTDQLSLVFQPIVCLANREIVSVETLLRWQHPTAGRIEPTEFISIAEECELIHPLGEWVLQAGCRQMANWIDMLGSRAPGTISINVSRKQFAQPTFFTILQNVLTDTRLSPNRLQLEITEVAFDGSVASAIETMHALSDLGVHLAVDDFGTGSSSFAAVHQFPINMLKVDRSLLAGIETSPETIAMIQALTVLADKLGITMVAEGIETQSQALMLEKLNCECAQGYFFAKPMSATEFEILLRQTTPSARKPKAVAVLSPPSFEVTAAPLLQ